MEEFKVSQQVSWLLLCHASVSLFSAGQRADTPHRKKKLKPVLGLFEDLKLLLYVNDLFDLS